MSTCEFTDLGIQLDAYPDVANHLLTISQQAHTTRAFSDVTARTEEDNHELVNAPAMKDAPSKHSGLISRRTTAKIIPLSRHSRDSTSPGRSV